LDQPEKVKSSSSILLKAMQDPNALFQLARNSGSPFPSQNTVLDSTMLSGT
jgi:hypothetical protein